MKRSFIVVGGEKPHEPETKKVLPQLSDTEINKLYKVYSSIDNQQNKFKGTKREYCGTVAGMVGNFVDKIIQNNSTLIGSGKGSQRKTKAELDATTKLLSSETSTPTYKALLQTIADIAYKTKKPQVAPLSDVVKTNIKFYLAKIAKHDPEYVDFRDIMTIEANKDDDIKAMLDKYRSKENSGRPTEKPTGFLLPGPQREAKTAYNKLVTEKDNLVEKLYKHRETKRENTIKFNREIKEKIKELLVDYRQALDTNQYEVEGTEPYHSTSTGRYIERRATEPIKNPFYNPVGSDYPTWDARAASHGLPATTIDQKLDVLVAYCTRYRTFFESLVDDKTAQLNFLYLAPYVNILSLTPEGEKEREIFAELLTSRGRNVIAGTYSNEWTARAEACYRTERFIFWKYLMPPSEVDSWRDTKKADMITCYNFNLLGKILSLSAANERIDYNFSFYTGESKGKKTSGGMASSTTTRPQVNYSKIAQVLFGSFSKVVGSGDIVRSSNPNILFILYKSDNRMNRYDETNPDSKIPFEVAFNLDLKQVVKHSDVNKMLLTVELMPFIKEYLDTDSVAYPALAASIAYQPRVIKIISKMLNNYFGVGEGGITKGDIKSGKEEDPTLSLNIAKESISDKLNTVGWSKYLLGDKENMVDGKLEPPKPSDYAELYSTEEGRKKLAGYFGDKPDDITFIPLKEPINLPSADLVYEGPVGTIKPTVNLPSGYTKKDITLSPSQEDNFLVELQFIIAFTANNPEFKPKYNKFKLDRFKLFAYPPDIVSDVYDDIQAKLKKDKAEKYIRPEPSDLDDASKIITSNEDIIDDARKVLNVVESKQTKIDSLIAESTRLDKEALSIIQIEKWMEKNSTAKKFTKFLTTPQTDPDYVKLIELYKANSTKRLAKKIEEIKIKNETKNNEITKELDDTEKEYEREKVKTLSTRFFGLEKENPYANVSEQSEEERRKTFLLRLGDQLLRDYIPQENALRVNVGRAIIKPADIPTFETLSELPLTTLNARINELTKKLELLKTTPDFTLEEFNPLYKSSTASVASSAFSKGAKSKKSTDTTTSAPKKAPLATIKDTSSDAEDSDADDDDSGSEPDVDTPITSSKPKAAKAKIGATGSSGSTGAVQMKASGKPKAYKKKIIKYY